jgi:Protein of unknown function (DUF664)
MADTPWEPPLAGTELEHLMGALDRLRTTFRWKVDDLDAAGLAVRVGASSLTLGGLLKHMAINEDYMFTRKLTGEPVGDPWESLWDRTDDWEFTSAADDTPEQLYASWEDAVERSRVRLDTALEQGGLDQACPRLLCSGRAREPAPPAVRPDRGVRPTHRPRRPAS